MRKFKLKHTFVLITLSVFSIGSLYGQSAKLRAFKNRPEKSIYNVPMDKVIENGDTIYLDRLRTLYVYPPIVFSSKKQEKFYWRTVRDVKIALPYARLASHEITNLNRELFYMDNDVERKAKIKEFQKRMFREHERDLKDLTINQGKMMIKLVDREYDMNVYDIIKAYKGGLPAGFWNTIARFFGSDLKMDYSASDKDRIIERVIDLVDSGQL